MYNCGGHQKHQWRIHKLSREGYHFLSICAYQRHLPPAILTLHYVSYKKQTPSYKLSVITETVCGSVFWGLIYSNGHSRAGRPLNSSLVTEANVPLIYSTVCEPNDDKTRYKETRCTRVRQHVSGQCKQPLRHQATDARQPRRIRSTSKILRITVEPGWLS